MYEKFFGVPEFHEVVKIVESLGEKPGLAPIRVAFLRNITLDPVDTYVKYFCSLEKMNAVIYMGEYDVVMQEVLDANSGLYRFSPDVIVICLKLEALSGGLWYGFAGMAKQALEQEKARVLEYMDSVLKGIRSYSGAAILVHNFEGPPYPAYGIFDGQDPDRHRGALKNLSMQLHEIVRRYPDIYLVDVDRIQSALGYENYFDRRYWHIGRAPYTRAAALAIAGEYVKFIRALKGRAKKCLVLDCDNTLWGGIIGEDGINNIQIGKTYPGSAFLDFQKSILNLYHRGVMLALCSKNNVRDVIDVLERHPEMVLRKEHFVSMRVNWGDKVNNLREISQELNIGLDSMVFVDDSEFEINSVKRLLPEVLTVHMSGDPVLYGDFLNSCGLFDTLTFSEEDRKRSEMYRAEENRKKAASSMQHLSLDGYYRYLEMEVEVNPADSYSIPRIAQLCQRTNQFNLTTKRYTEADIAAFATSDEYSVIHVQVRDRFGDIGIVGSAVLKFSGGICYIDSFMLSCRVIGRGVEDVLLKNCERLARKRSCTRMVGMYIPTGKNVIAAEFYDQRGFRFEGDISGAREYSFSLESSLKTPDYFKAVHFFDE
ncbi:MAG: HAD-IIIC family phosphatase [Bacillota bacterium]